MKAPVTAGLVLLGVSAALAQPAVPPAELPGRERERFFDRFQSPNDLRNDPGLQRQDPRGAKPKRERAKPRPKPQPRSPSR